MYIYIHIYRLYIDVYNTYIYIAMYTYMHMICVYIYTDICIYIYIYTYICTILSVSVSWTVTRWGHIQHCCFFSVQRLFWDQDWLGFDSCFKCENRNSNNLLQIDLEFAGCSMVASASTALCKRQHTASERCRLEVW